MGGGKARTLRRELTSVLGPEHAILLGLRERRSETELTRVLASLFTAAPDLAAAFVGVVLRSSKRPNDPRWDALPAGFACRSEVQLPEGRADLEFTNLADGWPTL